MASMKKRPNMQLVGEKIRHLRIEKGLSKVAFASALIQPLWLITLVESASEPQSAALTDLLSDSVIRKLLDAITKVFDVSYRWLTTSEQSPKHPPLECPAPEEPILFLPVALSPEDAVDYIDALLSLATATTNSKADCSRIFRQNIVACMELFELQLTAMEHASKAELANELRKRYLHLMHEQQQKWERKLNAA